jgi:hypothetical protein
MTEDESIALAAALGSQENIDDLTVLLEILSMDQILKLMIIFGGKSISVPKMTDFTDSIKIATAACYGHRNSVNSVSAAAKIGIPNESERVYEAMRVLKRYDANRKKMQKAERDMLELLGL